VQRHVVEHNAVKTAANLAGSETTFRLGIAALLIVAALDVVVAWGLLRVFEPVSSSLSLLTAVYAPTIVGVLLAQALRMSPETEPK
jgi:hypothetical protein